MTTYSIYLNDATLPVQRISYFMTIEWWEDGKKSLQSEELKIIETQYDYLNSAYAFDDFETALFVSEKLEMDVDELMDECVSIIHKNGE